ncbi:uncharacterized protein TRIVIDRAFT_174572 [Trichoderma virens Gv29-8]|uniref:Transcription initiation factor TFIID subunit 4 n=1 Tax=Hypocrea virens (strain Gv29-8 / FGSC 10586) TaxID=413071 RepID=G9NAJ1_HYPVG|nr:uncharacterized protein TRIVIDRAFT_174572 [Trichoderma virens Gv29-8]EHK15852.1 hypothetical protein TRIVIDRAFT_174572 [Trichoderma virens Gv29-8]
MAQPQPSPQVPPRAFSPPQPSPSPATSHSGFALPPNKRVRTDGPGSQPGSPYAASPYTMSPVPVATPPTTAGSPTYPQAQTPPVQAGYAMPYTNGHPPPAQGLSLPTASPTVSSPAMHTPQPPPVQAPIPMQIQMPGPTPMQVPTPGQVQTPGHTPGIMGPPQKPAERPTKDYEYDVTDSLAGTGIDLRAEEQYMAELYSNALESIPEARTGFAHYTPGSKSTFYGAGPANQPAQPTDLTQKQYTAQAAEQAWQESTMRLAVQRTQEINDPFLLVALLHRRAEKIAREHHLGLNLELKNNVPSMGKMKLPDNFATPKVTVKTSTGPDGALVETSGSFIPHDAFLVDQLALLSIATKQRVRELVEDANVVARTRQKTSHGDIPSEWAAAAAPVNAEPLEPMVEKDGDANGAVAGTGTGTEAGQGTSPLKRPADANDAAVKQPPAKLPKIASYATLTMRDLARQEREWEEARLRRRQMRKEGLGDSAVSASRAGSVAPGTPGSVAPESEKAMTKKELKKTQAMKAAEASSHANQNITSSMFAGLGGKGSLFGKKKSGKTYDWMNVGRGGSGASTPTRAAPGPGKGPNGVPGAPSPGNMALTTEGRNRLGTWREDKEKGKNIQLRDWITVLERDGREARALQHAYINLDNSNPK